MNISLSEEGKNLSFAEFKKVFGKHYQNKPKIDIKKEYERLTGKKVGSKSNSKKAKEL